MQLLLLDVAFQVRKSVTAGNTLPMEHSLTLVYHLIQRNIPSTWNYGTGKEGLHLLLLDASLQVRKGYSLGFQRLHVMQGTVAAFLLDASDKQDCIFRFCFCMLHFQGEGLHLLLLDASHLLRKGYIFCLWINYVYFFLMFINNFLLFSLIHHIKDVPENCIQVYQGQTTANESGIENTENYHKKTESCLNTLYILAVLQFH